MTLQAQLRTDLEGATKVERKIPGEEGLWVFLLGDMGIFALFFGTLLVTRGKHPDMWHLGQSQLHPLVGILNTCLLLTGSYLVVLASRHVGDGTKRASRLFLATLACAGGFAVAKATEYVLLINAGHTASTSDFFMYYFVFTGIHLAHLVIGAILMFALSRVVRPETFTERRRRFVECGACYWHMVDLLWLVLFPLLYLVR
jgi:nitric oxide reductase NorE protein